MRRLDLFVREGDREQAKQTINILALHPPPAGECSRIADWLLEREDWELSRSFIAKMPQSEPGHEYLLLDDLEKTGNPAEIDQWLAECARASQYWQDARLGYRAKLGTQEPLLDALADDARSHPMDLPRLQAYLHAVRIAGTRRDLSWIGVDYRPALAWDNYALGQEVTDLSAQAAISLFQRSLSLPFTEQDHIRMREAWLSQVENPELYTEKRLRAATKLSLAAAYNRIGQADKAQPLIEEVSREYKDGLPPAGLSQFAGQTQMASGARVIEKRFQDAELSNQNSADYWLARSDYYKGRQEPEQAKTAQEKALTIYDDARRKSTLDSHERYDLTERQSRLLVQLGRAEEAFALLHQEFDLSSPNAGYGWSLVNVANGFDTDIGAREYQRLFAKYFGHDERAWDYLTASPQWDDLQKKILILMAIDKSADGFERFYKRAEPMVQNADPSRAVALSWAVGILSPRGQALIHDALRRMPDGPEGTMAGNAKNAISSQLLEVYLEDGDWRKAEDIWPEGRKELISRELSDFYGQIAVVAAKKGAKKDAMRLWQAAANLDWTDLRHLDEMAGMGLKPELMTFYRHLAAENPASAAPPEALRQLQSLSDSGQEPASE